MYKKYSYIFLNLKIRLLLISNAQVYVYGIEYNFRNNFKYEIRKYEHKIDNRNNGLSHIYARIQ